MEFDELKKIWDAQNNQQLYVINEEALHKRVLTKKNQAGHIVNTSELLSIFVNLGGGAVVLGKCIVNDDAVISLYALSAWMLMIGMYCLANRIRRIKVHRKFDRSMSGELNYALTDATYQVQLSRLMRWNLFSIGLLLLVGLYEIGRPLWMGVVILTGVFLLFYLSGFEDNFYKRRKRELETLLNKLVE